MNKSYFAFFELSILNSVKQILKKQLFSEEELRRKWRNSQVLLNITLATGNIAKAGSCSESQL